MADPKMLKLIIVCEEFKPDGDDLMTLLAVNYAVRGCIAPFGLNANRGDMTPAAIRTWIAEAASAGEDVLVVVVLTAAPPSRAERRQLDADYLHATTDIIERSICYLRSGRLRRVRSAGADLWATVACQRS